MQFIAIALMGFFAFSANATAPAELATPLAIEEEAADGSIALKDAGTLVRAGEDAPTLTVKLTSYNAVPEQTDSNPHITASGVATNPEVIAARSVDLAATLPFGTVIALERAASDNPSCQFNKVESLIGYRVVADSMHSRKRAQIDVQLDPTDTVLVNGREINPSIALGVCNGVTVRVIGKIGLDEIPATQAELVELVVGNALAVR